MIAVGDELWVEYDEPPPRLAHKRVVVGVSAAYPEHFAVLSPGFDVFIEECDAANTDIKNWWKHWPNGAPPGASVLPAPGACLWPAPGACVWPAPGASLWPTPGANPAPAPGANL